MEARRKKKKFDSKHNSSKSKHFNVIFLWNNPSHEPQIVSNSLQTAICKITFLKSAIISNFILINNCLISEINSRRYGTQSVIWGILVVSFIIGHEVNIFYKESFQTVKSLQLFYSQINLKVLFNTFDKGYVPAIY